MNNRIKKDFMGGESNETRFAKSKGILNKNLIDLGEEKYAPIRAIMTDMINMTNMTDMV